MCGNALIWIGLKASTLGIGKKTFSWVDETVVGIMNELNLTDYSKKFKSNMIN